MKTEYLITFDSKDSICSDVEKFRKLLSTHNELVVQSKLIKFNNIDYPIVIATGVLTDGSVYYDLSVENNNVQNIENYSALLKVIRTVCQKYSGRQIIILHDGVGEYYCELGYPVIFKIENLMRKLISKFMAMNVGYDWTSNSTPKEVSESVKGGGRKEKTNFLMEVDFIQLSKFLFTSYTNSDFKNFVQSLKTQNNDDVVKISDLKNYVSYTNWERYFQDKVKIGSEYISSRWEKLYDIRCQIAHSRGLSKLEFDDLILMSSQIQEIIETALNSIDDIHIDQIEREQLAENLTGSADSNFAKFIEKYNVMAVLLKEICYFSSSPDDSYNKTQANASNIKMQADYLFRVKGVLSESLRNNINGLQFFKNTLVHKTGLINIDFSEVTEQLAVLEEVVSFLSGLKVEDVEKLKGIDRRNIYNNDWSQAY